MTLPPRAPAFAVILSCAMLLAGCSGRGNNDSLTPAELAARAPETSVPEDYVIGAGDSLSVFVYHNPDLSEPGVAVRPDGRISVPLIEDILAAGKTPTQLARDVEERLKKYVQDPVVTVIVRSFVGAPDRQIRVIGEATDPQAIPYRERMTLLDVMIATKGLTKYAAGNRASIVRKGPDGKDQTVRVHLSDLLKDGDISQNLDMFPGDTLVIPQAWF